MIKIFSDSWSFLLQDLAERRDLRNCGIDICSIDPPGCTDIDDALHCRVLDNGNFEVCCFKALKILYKFCIILF